LKQGVLVINYKLFDKIDNTSAYSDAYKQKLKDTYLWFKEHGYEFTEHGLNRVISPKRGKREFSKEDVLSILEKPVNYLQGNNKKIKFYDGFSVIQATDTGEVISFVDNNYKTSENWRERNDG